MYLTEDEARGKWCERVRSMDLDDNVSGNCYRANRMPSFTCCIASNCMMWRRAWVKVEEDATCFDEREVSIGYIAPISLEGWTRGGYCGLAGRPE